MRLRPFIPERDFDRIRDWITDERAHALWCANRFAYPLERENMTGVLRAMADMAGDSPFAATDDDGTVTGFFCYSFSQAANEGGLKFVVIDPALRGRGLGAEMLRLAVEYAFEVTKAEAVRLNVFPQNTRAVKCYERAGFTAERTDTGVFRYQDEAWDRCSMILRKGSREKADCGRWIVRHNDLNAEQFKELWESVWDGAPTPEQTELALAHSLFRVSVFDGDRIIAMARMIGDLGMCYYIKDVIVRPEYQRRGIGRLLVHELLTFVQQNGIRGTDIAVELCAMPDKMPFYAQFGFSANEAQRLRRMYHVETREKNQ